jgi:NAD(P)H-hydrate epimerase
VSDFFLPAATSHKGQNGKLLIVGGSKLFHAASKWSLDVASKIVDMVFYASVKENNQLIQEAKGNFWNGIVIERKHIDHYAQEADCILIGPGMDRSFWTKRLTNRLVKKFAHKRMVIDAGALQMIDPNLLQSQHIITPHHQEMALLHDKDQRFNSEYYQAPCHCLLKGPVDKIFAPHDPQPLLIEGGNAGMTKGGSGDVLAGLLAALYCKNEALVSMELASQVNKQAGEVLFQQQGPFFNASDLVEVIPQLLWQHAQLEQL